jgi:hypothetical protein
MKQLLFHNWSLMRILRIAFAIYLFTQAYYLQQWFFIAFGVFFLLQALFNIGCGSKGCSLPKSKQNED